MYGDCVLQLSFGERITLTLTSREGCNYTEVQTENKKFDLLFSKTKGLPKVVHTIHLLSKLGQFFKP